MAARWTCKHSEAVIEPVNKLDMFDDIKVRN